MSMMNRDLARRLARIEQMTHHTPPDVAADAAHLRGYEASLGAEFVASLLSPAFVAAYGPVPPPTQPGARLDALRNALVFYLTGCLPPTGPDPIPDQGASDASEQP